MLQSWTCSGGWCHCWCRCRWVRTTMPITALCDSITVSDFNPGKQGLNSRLRPCCKGGGVSVLTHYLTTWLEMDGQLGTHDGSSGRPSALLKKCFPTQIAVHPTKYKYIVFVTGEDDIARYNYRRYRLCLTRVKIKVGQKEDRVNVDVLERELRGNHYTWRSDSRWAGPNIPPPLGSPSSIWPSFCPAYSATSNSAKL
jgi:hypothetical protein